VTTTDQNQQARAAAARKFAIESARLAASTRCHSVVVLDVGGLSPVCDYFVIATGTSPRQMRTVADDIVEFANSQGFAPLNESGLEGQTWLLVDCIDVIIHLFNEEARHYYDLDNLWGDAKPVEWEQKEK
jgi:ribosome-associated protein